ncbi:hypothetical protein DOK78_000196 [Enterococcus sp. DIV2402]|uniref:Uncharacterized protein n=1 Tax=Candidatus Enterococcus lowellii TaxID=2230877 RepID=A0ABZ2SKW5_9ENTE|nr:hypothetical protein [Enterococcus sp. DIV2402]
MVKQVSGEQRKNVIRKRTLSIIVSAFVVLLFFTGYLLYQEVYYVHNFFSPEISTKINIRENEENTWQRVKFEENSYLKLNGIFWKKELINDASSENVIDIGIYENDGITLVKEFTLEPGKAKKMTVDKGTDYVVKVKANQGAYVLNII